ncbi:hypothetical protein [Pseudocitrobacter sp. RIT415]|uniref:hypothetical protein n=1 Tax=Pseudocitrobacter sp. RIT415 TaxID=2202163 RepID=UPI001F163BE5|nr:hypothetical protein [Pseudocitrobacter sp. RIT 415]
MSQRSGRSIDGPPFHLIVEQPTPVFIARHFSGDGRLETVNVLHLLIKGVQGGKTHQNAGKLQNVVLVTQTGQPCLRGQLFGKRRQPRLLGKGLPSRSLLPQLLLAFLQTESELLFTQG